MKAKEKSLINPQPKALVVDEHSTIAETLQGHGYLVHKIDPRAILADQSKSVKCIRRAEFATCWIVAPLKGRHVPSEKYSACCEAIAAMILASVDTQTPTLVIGAFGRFWQHEAIHRAATHEIVQKHHHRLCHFGLKVDSDALLPSSACLITLSIELPIRGHPCKCPTKAAETHVMDWVTEGYNNNRNEAINRIGLRLLQDCSAVLAIHGASNARKQASTTTSHGTPDSISNNQSTNFDAPPETSAYPTEERIMQKARAAERKKNNQKPVKRKKMIEDHYDDCGADISSLAPGDDELGEASEVVSTAVMFTMNHKHAQEATSLAQAFAFAQRRHSQLDIVEICGGEARCSSIALRLNMFAGDNFDLKCHCDLNDPRNQKLVQAYIAANKPLVTLMSPVCTPYGPLSNLVRHVHPESWTQSLMQAQPHGRFCGKLALMLDQIGLYYLVEHPYPSRLWSEPEWKAVLKRQSTRQLVIHQCAAGQKGPGGGPAKKPTTLLANSETLLEPCTDFVCPGNHTHEYLDGGRAKHCQTWPWKMAQAIIDGVIKLKQELTLRAKPSQAYPTVGTGPGDPDLQEEAFRKCLGCRSHLSKYDARHTRKQGECRWPDTEPMHWDCPGCKKDRPEAHSSHTHGPDCKHAIISHRQSRRGRHPRAPSIPSRRIPGMDSQAQLPDGSDLMDDPPRDPEARGSTDALVDRQIEDQAKAPPVLAPDIEVPREQRRGRGPDREERLRRVFRDAEAGPEVPSDWTRFDITGCLRLLRSSHQPTVLKTLRKIHLRLWHAGVSNMQSILRNAGIAQHTLDLIPDVIATCKECRMWAARPRDTQTAVEIPMEFNEIVETDLLFFREHVIQHFVDRASRWHASIVSTSRSEDQLLENIAVAWTSIFGPMKTLVTDPESGLNTPSAIGRLKRTGTILKIKGKDQHARYVERRGAVLRHSLHVAQTQADREGLNITFKELLAHCTFAGNSLTHVGGVTPYQVVMGRQPSMLPPISDTATIDERQEARIREIALQSMISATSAARIQRAITTVTQRSEQFQPGDMVELYRKPSSKDNPGWSGPYPLVECKTFDGVAVLKVNGVDRPYRIQDIRHALLVIELLGIASADTHAQALKVIHSFLTSLSPNRIEAFGLAEDEGGDPYITTASRKWPKVAKALNYVIKTALQMQNVAAARLGREVRHLPHYRGPQPNIILNWDMANPDHISAHTSENSKANVTQIFGQQHPHFAILQCLNGEFSAGMLLEDVVEPLNSYDLIRSDRSSQPASENPVHSRLSTIPEETHVTNSQAVNSEAEILFAHSFPNAMKEDKLLLLSLCVDAVNESPETSELEKYGIDPNLMRYLEPENPEEEIHEIDLDQRWDTVERDASGAYVAITIEASMSPCFDQPVSDSEELIIKMYLSSEAKKEVISRDTDILSPAELVTHKKDVDAAIVSEYQTWTKYNCFEAVRREDAPIIIDARLVLKWKYVEGKRKIRARLALRGFKEPFREDEQNFAGTAKRLSQRILSSVAATHPTWSFGAADVPKAFLQGLTFQELETITGEPRKHIAFTLPTNTANLLRQVPQFRHFNERTHVLSCIKPGTGCRDAPRAFSLRLMRLLTDFGLVSSLYDPQLMMLHRDKQLQLLISVHVDDIKFTGDEVEVQRLMTMLQATFGTMVINKNVFTNCGMCHERQADGAIHLHQDEYIKALKCIHPKHYNHLRAEDPCDSKLQALYMSLVGAVAYSTLTQAWVSVFLVALQRRNKQATVADVRRLNAVTRELVKRPQRLKYKSMTPTGVIEVFSDSAFSREGDTAHTLKGMTALLIGRDQKGTECCHLLESLSQTHKLVVRSTFGAELLAATSAVDNSYSIAITFHELGCGPLTADQAMRIREGGGCTVKMHLLIDAMSVFQAVKQENFKAPTEKSLLSHIAWLKEMLGLGHLSAVSWCDTRDMIADGLTKGKVPRDLLLMAMSGVRTVNHPHESFKGSRR